MISNAILALLAAAFTFTSAAPVSLNSRIVVNPPLTYPNATTVWYTGQANVTAKWTVPSYATGYTGRLVLGYLDKNDTSGSEHLFSPPLAEGFNLTDGQVTFDIPCDTNIKSRATYILVLMGDSGNKGAEFTIHRNATACPNFLPKVSRTSSAAASSTKAPEE